jgi:SSS family solute:Na+ symporter
MPNQIVEYAVIAAYLAVILAVGPACRKLNSDTSDYFRSGSRGTWWIVGMSSFMSGISALTFTGNGGAAFSAGWSVLAIYAGGIAAYVFHALLLGRWFRQLRVTTFPEALRARFGPATQQVYAILGIGLAIIAAAVWLLGLAIFASTCFALPLHLTIPALGFTVLFYSTVGGRWAVLATDFIQGIVMLVMTVLLTVLSLIYAGGIGSFFREIQAQDLSATFALIKPDGAFAANDYTWEWLVAIFTIQFISASSMALSVRYFAVKDGRAASQAAWLTAALTLAGTLLWFIPPMVARLYFADEVLASGMPKPEEAAFAVVAIKLLPAGLVGMIVVAMFSATMSSVDTGLNGNAAMLIRDILPALFRRWGRPLPPESRLLLWSRMTTVVFGLMVIGLAYYLSVVEGVSIFKFAIGLSATLTMPMAIPLTLCLFVRRVPPWACLFSMGAAMVPSLVHFANPELMSYGTRVLWVTACGVLAFLATIPFPRTPTYQRQVDAFFTAMRRPVDFDKEVGGANDSTQLLIMSRFALVIGGLMLLLLFVPNPAWGRVAILGCALAIFGLGVAFHLRGVAGRGGHRGG